MYLVIRDVSGYKRGFWLKPMHGILQVFRFKTCTGVIGICAEEIKTGKHQSARVTVVTMRE